MTAPRTLLLVLLGITACDSGGGDDSSQADAPITIDASGMPACTGALYDRCLDVAGGTDCMSGICRVFNMLGANGCTQACNATTPCPNDPMGGTVNCNMMGQCRPNVLRACTP